MRVPASGRTPRNSPPYTPEMGVSALKSGTIQEKGAGGGGGTRETSVQTRGIARGSPPLGSPLPHLRQEGREGIMPRRRGDPVYDRTDTYRSENLPAEAVKFGAVPPKML